MTDTATNRAIAEAMGWTEICDASVSRQATGKSPLSDRRNWLPDYLHDANAALEAAREILQCGFEMWWHHDGQYFDAMYDTVGHPTAEGEGDTLAGAICAMILAVLAERAEDKR
ncbi:hypothetical protein LCGC14_0568660 [marine sediment metagenome]|uniref:Phage ABA sandwich domain-containing protein n=1 Tax=marine sediment metagenome TaxID=412755 RepID=A0A0F9RJV1_9ZZZZ|nr:hypothetical protein [Phycisphaerae bacterium]